MKPCVQFLELLVDNPEELFEEYILREQNRRKGMKPINYFFKNYNKDNESNLKIDMDDENEDMSELVKKPKKR